MITALPRRELATRRAPWARRLASTLERLGVQPNTVSMMSIAFSLVALASFALVPRANGSARAALFIAAAAAIQLRLLCNLLDGMLAVEGGLKTRTGELYNEVPDRVADIVILAGAGCSIPGLAGGFALGSAAAISAMFTAYVRVLAGALGGTQRFIGPMAKQHRMFVLTVGALVSAIEAIAGLPAEAMRLALGVIVIGAVATAWRRIESIARELEAR